MDITYRLTGPWGPGKGANLQPAEVDNNFWAIAQAIVDLETNPAIPVGIENISMSGSSMTITLTDGTVMGPFLIPVLTFAWRGEWQPFTSYAELDVFTVQQVGIFMVTLAHTSGADFDRDIQIGGVPALLQLFGAVDASLNFLDDVNIGGGTGLHDQDFLQWNESVGEWWPRTLGSMAFQYSSDVLITGGRILGMGTPTDPSEVATKAYVDSLPTGATAGALTLMSNITASPAPAIPNTLSDYLDAALATANRGTLIYRGVTGWVALPPGTVGYFLKTNGLGGDPEWELGGSGVVSISAGTGISTGGAAITASGTVSLADIADNNLLANISGGVGPPVPLTLSAYLDDTLGNARGSVLVRAGGGWVALAPGTAGYFLKTQGTGLDPVWDAPAGVGTVTSISAGTGISTGGSPITGSGTVSLAAIGARYLLANNTGSSAAPAGYTLTQYLDGAVSSAQGTLLYRSNTGWVSLAPGTTGQFLATGGSAGNPSWADAPTTGAAIPNNRIISNVSGSNATPSGNTLTNILDSTVSSSRGTILFRSNSGWTGLAPGPSGQVLQSAGTVNDPVWVANYGGMLAVTSAVHRDILVYNSSSGKFENARPKYEIGCYVPGLMTASQNLLFHRFSKAVTLPANLGQHLNHSTVAGGSVAATGSTIITLARASTGSPTSFSNVASLTIAAGSVNASLSTQAAIAFGAGDVLRVRGPATADATFADFHMSLVGYET